MKSDKLIVHKENISRTNFIKQLIFGTILIFCFFSCKQQKTSTPTSSVLEVKASDILGNPDYLAISYGGYRQVTRDTQPTIAELKDDMKILAAMDIKVLRTYNTHFEQASNLLAAIRELKQEDPNFEMYVMLGVWINCQNAFTANPIHDKEDEEANAAEIQRAVSMAKEYPDIVKIIAVGNEAMVKWAASYFVEPWIILKWVNHLQGLKNSGELPEHLWITSSDNFASWGGDDAIYHVEDLEKLIRAVDFVSLHTYPMHDTHYNPDFWGVQEEENSLSELEKIEKAMDRAKQYAIDQFQSTEAYIRSIREDVPMHIGETGWASYSNGHYGNEGSRATDEYKEALYYEQIREWTNENRISCFYFEAFDEIWKDAQNSGGSENHFGLFKLNGEAKYALWDLVDQGVFNGLTRNGNPIGKTYKGDEKALLKDVLVPPAMETVM